MDRTIRAILDYPDAWGETSMATAAPRRAMRCTAGPKDHSPMRESLQWQFAVPVIEKL